MSNINQDQIVPDQGQAGGLHRHIGAGGQGDANIGLGVITAVAHSGL